MKSFRMEVDGEVFGVSASPTGHDVYDWLSGPNAGYGFSSWSSDRSPSTMTDHEDAIRDFLSAIDPETGYIGDDEDEDD